MSCVMVDISGCLADRQLIDMDDGQSNDGIGDDPALDGCVALVVRCTHRIDAEWLSKIAILEGPQRVT